MWANMWYPCFTPESQSLDVKPYVHHFQAQRQPTHSDLYLAAEHKSAHIQEKKQGKLEEDANPCCAVV